MKQRRGIRSIIIRAGIFLLLGAIVNVAVVWERAPDGYHKPTDELTAWTRPGQR